MLAAKFECVYAGEEGKNACDVAGKTNTVKVPGLTKTYCSQLREYPRRLGVKSALIRSSKEAAFYLRLNRW